MDNKKIRIQNKDFEENDIIDLRKEKEVYFKSGPEENIYIQKEYFQDRVIRDQESAPVVKEKNNADSEFRGEERAGFLPFSNKWLGYGKFFLYVLILLIPLFFLPLTIAPIETNKLFLAVILVFLSFICYLANTLSVKKIVFPKAYVSLAVFILVLSVALSFIFSQSRYISLYGSLTQPDSLLAFIVYGLVFFLAGVFFNKDDFNKIGAVFLAGLVLTSILGALQMLGIFIFPFDFAAMVSFNTVGTFFSYGVFIAFGLLMSVAALSEPRLSLPAKGILVFSILLAIVQLFALNFRMLWIEIALGMLLLVAYRFADSTDRFTPGGNFNAGGARPNSMGISLAIMIIAFLFFLISPSLPQIVNMPIQIKPNFSSTMAVAKETLKGRQMLLGTGPSTFGYNFTLWRPAELNQTDFWPVRFNQGVSFFMTFLSSAGIIGASAFLFLIFSFIFLAIKNLGNTRLLVIALGVLFLLAELFLNESFFIQFIFIFLGLGLMLSFSSSCRKISLADASKTKVFAAFILTVSLITVSLAFLFSVGQKYAAAVYYREVFTARDFKSSFDNLTNAAMLDPESDLYLRDLSQYFLLDINNQSKSEKNKANSQEEADRMKIIIQNDIASAMNAAQKATVINPVDSANWSNLANIYEKIISAVDNAETFAVKNYEEAIKRDPKNPALGLSLAKALLASADIIKAKNAKSGNADNSEWRKKMDEAEAAVKKAIDLKADYLPAHFQLAMVYVRREKMGDAIAKLEELKKAAPADSDLSFQLGVLYYTDKQMAKAQAELERTLTLNDKYSNARYVLGLIYDKDGKRIKALDQFEQILALNPDNQEIKKIIKNLNEGKAALNGMESSPASIDTLQETKQENPVEKTPRLP